MEQLTLTDDELAMLRFTCDLFFVEESPLFFLEAEKRAPYNYGEAYRQLESKQVVDPATFQVTDNALNRIAPITECDARVIHTHITPTHHQTSDFYLLDEIIVKYNNRNADHLMGVDMDTEEFIQRLGKRLTPRSSAGDMLQVDLTPLEVVAIATLLNPLKENPSQPIEQNIKHLPKMIENNQTVIPPSGQSNTLNALGVRTLPQKNISSRGKDPQTNEATWEKAFEGLYAKSILKKWDNTTRVNQGFKDFFFSLDKKEHHSFIRYDFGDDEWFIRETTLIPTQGSLYWIGMDKKGLVTIKELDSDHLRAMLVDTVGPLKTI